MILSGNALAERFQALDAFLGQHQDIWRPRPFTLLELPWETRHPILANWLRARSLEQAETQHNHPEQLTEAPPPYPELAAQARQLISLGQFPSHSLGDTPHSLFVDVPGRKRQQIEAFASCLPFRTQPTHWLDWCSGKGHLGRLLAWPAQQLTCLESDPALVASGAQLSQRLHLQATHRQQDVLANDSAAALHSDHTPVALHACGDLHVRLLQLASAAGCPRLAVAPCCYNRISTAYYQPLSRPAQQSTLQLSLDDLRLPLSETVTASTRTRRQRDQSMAWRLAFDLLQRELRNSTEYLPTPSLPADWLHKPFADYCRDLAALKQLPPPPARNWSALEQQGWQRLAVVRNLELPRALFRRPLELWLLLDRALYLQEQGYQVQLGLFCASQLTPRNLLLLAERSA